VRAHAQVLSRTRQTFLPASRRRAGPDANPARARFPVRLPAPRRAGAGALRCAHARPRGGGPAPHPPPSPPPPLHQRWPRRAGRARRRARRARGGRGRVRTEGCRDGVAPGPALRSFSSRRAHGPRRAAGRARNALAVARGAERRRARTLTARGHVATAGVFGTSGTRRRAGRGLRASRLCGSTAAVGSGPLPPEGGRRCTQRTAGATRAERRWRGVAARHTGAGGSAAAQRPCAAAVRVGAARCTGAQRLEEGAAATGRGGAMATRCRGCREHTPNSECRAQWLQGTHS
jgi:hypothetical protein